MKKVTKKHGGWRPGSGRKPLGEEPMRTRAFMADDARWERYQAAAEQAGMGLAAWIRAACDRAADEQLKRRAGAR